MIGLQLSIKHINHRNLQLTMKNNHLVSPDEKKRADVLKKKVIRINIYCMCRYIDIVRVSLTGHQQSGSQGSEPLISHHWSRTISSYLSRLSQFYPFFLFHFLILWFLSQGVNLIRWGSGGQRLPGNVGPGRCDVHRLCMSFGQISSAHLACTSKWSQTSYVASGALRPCLKGQFT